MMTIAILLLISLVLLVCWSVWVSKGHKTDICVTPADYQLQAQTVSFDTTDHITISGWFLQADHSNKTIILVHGFGMNKGEVLKRTHFLAKKYNLLYLDCRGAGASAGHTQAGLQESKDIQAAVQFLRKTHPDLAQEIALYGISMGSAAVAYYTATYGNVKCLILESSYYSFKNVAKRWMWKHAKVPYFPFVASMVLWKERELGQKVENFALKQTASKITCPVLMIQGEKDKLTPVSKAQKTYNVLAGPKQLWVVPQAGHLSCYQVGGMDYIEKITRFLEENL